MHALFDRRHRNSAGVRIAAIALAGWWALLHVAGVAVAAPAFVNAWPNTDFTRRSVALDEILSGGPPKDGIPAIDRPKFVGVAQAGAWLDPREPVIGVERNGDARAYPLQILIYHEIVNDSVGGEPLAVTFCPLCNASLVFDRHVAGRMLDFGTTGLLRNSDLVMYDRQTQSWWQQFTGTAIVGELNGSELRLVPSSIVAFATFRASYPEGRVLSRDTGYSRPYGRNPYRGYDRIDNVPFLLKDPADARLPAMERVIGISSGGRHRIYPFEVLNAMPVINDRFGDIPVAVFSTAGTLSVLDSADIKASRTVPSATAYRRDLGGRVLTFELREDGIHDRETASRWNLFGAAVSGPLRGERLTPLPGGVHFAFAWLAFRPDTEIYAADR